VTNRGFGKPQLTEVDRLVERVVRYCQKQSPEALDRIFDGLGVGRTAEENEQMGEQILAGTVAQLQLDLDILAWFCGYMAGEVNRSEDNDRAYLPLVHLSKQLVEAGFQPFIDFVPYPGLRIVIMNPEKFEALPLELQAELQGKFDLLEKTGEEFQQVNEALKQEFVVME
jgi:hypothetical protein